MNEFTVSVRKLTDESLMREACSMTINGESHTSLKTIYKSEHSPARTQFFWVKLENITTAVASHLVRHHVGSEPFQLTCRPDRNGGSTFHTARINKIIAIIQDIRDDIRVASDWLLIKEVIESLEWLRDNSDRNTKVNLGLCLNAQSLIDMSKVRLCTKADADTRKAVQAIKEAISKVDPDLSAFMVPKCIYRNGLCGEPRCCGFNNTEAFASQLVDYVRLFNSTKPN